VLKPLRGSCLLVAWIVSCAGALIPARGEAAGEIYWFSLQTEDPVGAIRFYSGLFGWEIDTSPTGSYLMLRDGVPFASIAQIEDKIPDVSETLWLAAINVRNINESVKAAKALGATIRTDVTKLPGWGSFALIQDPQGAPFFLAAPERPLGGRLGYSGWRWAELWTHDPAAAEAFYSKVIGYTREDVAVGDETYSILGIGGTRNAGLVKLDQPEIAARWAPYVGVSDLRGILVRVWENGGKVLREPAELDFAVAGKNRIALIEDPSGGVLFLYQLEERATADPAAIADASANSMRARPAPPGGGGGGNPNVTFSVTVGVGFGPGWGAAYPYMPRGGIGPTPF